MQSMRTAIMAVSALVLVSGLGGGYFFLTDQNPLTDSTSEPIDTDGDGVYDKNDTFPFDPECSEDQNDNSLCDSREEEYDGASEEALTVSLETGSDTYEVHDDIEVTMNIENPAKTTAEDISHILSSVQPLGDTRSISEASNRLPAEDSSAAVFSTGFEDPSSAEENMVYQGRLIGEASAAYTTESLNSIEVLTVEQLRKDDQDREPERIPTMNRGGPLQLEINSRSPLIAEEENDSVRFNVSAGVSNLGEGEISLISTRTPVEMEMSLPNLESAPKNTCEKKFEMEFDQKSVQCTFEIEENRTGEPLTLTSEMEYDYKTTAEKSITFE